MSKYLNFKANKRLEIVHSADLSFVGLGSSSTFTVSLLHALHTMKNENVTKKKQLALEAIHVERNLIKKKLDHKPNSSCIWRFKSHCLRK